MNLYFRLLALIWQKLFRSLKVSPIAETTLTFRCLPADCDYNHHITNARFFSLCDLSRIGAMFDIGLVSKLMKKGIGPIVTAQTAIYYKDIRFGSKFTVRSRLLSWDEKFWYYRHDFVQKDSLKATIYAKGVFVAKRKIIPFADVVNLSGHGVAAPPLPEMVRRWSDSVDTMFRSAKNEAASNSSKE